jgi:C1A family cysteine protease
MVQKTVLITVGLLALLSAGALFYFHHRQHQNDIPFVTKDQVPTPVYDLWVHWQGKYQKKYASKDQDYRMSVFYYNYQKIQKHMSNTKRTYDMDFNHFMDLTPVEFKKFYNGLAPKTTARKEAPVTGDVAASVDWRTKGAVTPVKDQGQCGSCWAFSTTGSLEGFFFLTTGSLPSLSEQQLVDCSSSYGNQGCNGGLMDQAFQFVEASGITTESSYPYVAYDESCKTSSGSYKIKNFTDVPAGDANALITAVNGRPVAVAVDAENWQFYSGGVFSDCSTNLDHGVLLVGYDATSLIVKNSWGTSWGENGYIRLAKGNTCGIANAASYPSA